MQTIIRPADPNDYDALVEQLLGLNLHEEPIAKDRRIDRQGAVESLEVAWRRVRETNGRALVAVRDGHVVGHLFLMFKRDAVFVREAMRRYAYISDLFVREEARGAGIAKALMKEAERLAAARGVRRLMVGVLAGNGPAESLYASLGFTPRAIELVKRMDAR